MKYIPLAKRFSDTYMANPPGDSPHTLYVVSNGDNIQPGHKALFDPLPVNHITHNNFGKDIGAHIMAADVIQCDLMIFMGSHIHFRRPGWLDRIVNVYLENGPGLYGPWGFHQPALHLRTTCYWCPPEILRSYPYQVGDPQRYPFEHSPTDSIVAHTKKIGFPTMMVTWGGAYESKDWRHVENEDCLMLDQHTDSIGYH